jgi:8-oxo-dGTP pyrophosphatase MutT (NUDIX family)
MSAEPVGAGPSAPEAPRDAATVVLVRPRGAAGLEAFLLRRHAAIAFMGGAHVFPGGKVDAEDASPRWRGLLAPGAPGQVAASLGGDLDPGRALSFAVAALRELFEEAGVLLARGRDGRPLGAAAGDVARLARWRAERAAGLGFLELVVREGLELELGALVGWAHWLTPSAERRRYDTRFFVAALPPGQEAGPDREEATAEAWLSPEGALDAHAAGALLLPPPTRYTLAELSRLASLDAVRAEAAREWPGLVLPKVAADGGVPSILLPWDPGYPACPGEGQARPPPSRARGLPSRLAVLPRS